MPRRVTFMGGFAKMMWFMWFRLKSMIYEAMLWFLCGLLLGNKPQNHMGPQRFPTKIHHNFQPILKLPCGTCGLCGLYSVAAVAAQFLDHKGDHRGPHTNFGHLKLLSPAKPRPIIRFDFPRGRTYRRRHLLPRSDDMPTQGEPLSTLIPKLLGKKTAPAKPQSYREFRSRKVSRK